MFMNSFPYRHVIWDWNGTLLDDVSEAVGVMNTLLAKHTLPSMTVAQYQKIFDFPVIDYYKRLGFDFNREPFESLSLQFVTAYNESFRQCSLHDGVREFLSALQAAGISQSILSAAQQDHLEDATAHFQLNPYFIKLVGLPHCHATSKIQQGKNWLASLPFPPQDILLIGDTIHDYEVATELGCDCILIAAGHHSAARLSKCPVPVFHSLRHFIQSGLQTQKAI